MEQLKSAIRTAISTFFTSSDWWKDVIDILLITFLIYQLIRLVRRTRAAQLIQGIVIVVVGYLISLWFDLKTVKFLFQNVLQIGLLALVVVFQPEIRRALEQVGRGGFSFLSNRFVSEQFSMWHQPIVAICESVEHMAEDNVGALIVIERTTGLNEIVGTGSVVDAAVSAELIETVFYEGSPLHDGAMIVASGRIRAAGCLLPLSSNLEISRDMGTRHRAALGMSENSDAMIIVVSEETGIISIAQNGVIIRRLDSQNLFRMLSNELVEAVAENGGTKTKWRLFKR